MRITDIHIDGFGIWHDLKLQQLSPRLTAFYGANEAGKTTLMQFLRSMLYGISPERRGRYLPPRHGGAPGGSLGVVDRQEPFEVRRIADRGADDVGYVSITDHEGHTAGDRLLREALGDVDERTFNNVFAVGLHEIQQLDALSGTKAAEWLYRLTSGLDRVSLYDVIQNLRRTRREILSGSDQSSKLQELSMRREVLLGEIEQLKQHNRQWAQLAVRIKELDAEIEAREAEVRQCEHHARTLEIAVSLKPNWRKREKLSEQLQQLSGGIQLPDDALQRLDDLNRKIEEHQRQADILAGQRRQLREDCEQLGINELLVKNAHRIEALAEQRDWLQSLERQMDDLTAEAGELEQRLTGERQRIARGLGVADHQRLQDVRREEIEELQPFIQAVRNAQKQVDAAQREHDVQLESERSLKSQIESAIVGGERHNLPMDLEEASDLVARLRHRQQVDKRIEQARKHQTEMQQQTCELLDDQVMPLSLFGWTLAAVVLGSLMVGLWLIVPESPLGRYGSWMALVGLTMTVFSFLFKFFTEDAAADKLDACQRQLKTLARQIEEAEAEKEQLEEELQLTDGSAAIRLEAAEKHLEELESILPVEAQRRQAGHGVASAESRLAQAAAQLDKALAAWKAKLVGLGFSEKLDPKEFLSITERYETLSELDDRVQHRREDLAQRQREHAAITRRVHDIAAEVGCLLEAEDQPGTLDQLEHLVEARAKQLADIQRRETLIERAKQLKAEEAKHRRAAAGLQRRREAQFHAADCDDEIAYRRLAEQQREAERLRKECQAVSREIAAAIGTHAPEETIAEYLSPERIGCLDELWETASTELESQQEAMKALVDQRGACRQEQRRLAQDRTLAERQLELGCVEKQIEDARQTWREHATVNRILERVRVHYEAHRQPETLAEATKYLSKLTGGEYARIWTPIADDVLLVENSAGESLGVELLSRGAREQLFLSVRLALAATFARRGVNLPMVLDDVLVNFDATRAQRAAEVLCEFAAGGHQLLVFTCHEHVWRMFQQLEADCRQLPDRRGKARSVETVEGPAEEVFEIAKAPAEPEPPAEVDEDPTVFEPALFYDYPFVERIEAEVPPETPREVELSEVETDYGWAANEMPTDAAGETLAYVVPEGASTGRRQRDHLEPRRA
jgi:uncharacterized protein YhaN